MASARARVSRSGVRRTAASSTFAWASVSAGFFPPQPHPQEEVVREEGLRHVVVPAPPGAHLVVVHPELALRFLERDLHGPARAGRRGRAYEREVGGGPPLGALLDDGGAPGLGRQPRRDAPHLLRLGRA